MIRTYFFICFIGLLLLGAGGRNLVYGQENSERSAPKLTNGRLVSPWVFVNVDSRWRSLNRQALATMRNQLARRLGTVQAVNLPAPAYAPLRDAIKDVLWIPQGGAGLTLWVPVLVRDVDGFSMHLLQLNATNGELLGAKGLGPTKDPLSQALDSLVSPAATSPERSDNLVVRLESHMQRPRGRQVMREELGLLGALLPTVRALSPFGARVLRSLARAQWVDFEEKRSTLAAVLSWEPAENRGGTLRAKILDGVRGHRLENGETTDNWAAADIRAPNLLARLEQERARFNDEAPKVIKIRGAWAYLDKGRGYGLQIRQRLVAEDGQVAGHVVRYFGTKDQVKDNSGQMISDGAILYVRSGLTQLQVGSAFNYDKKRFPAPLP